MLDDHLPVGVRYSREKVPQRSVGLRIVLLLGVRNRLGLPRVRGSRGIFLADLSTRLFDNGTPDMVASAAHLKCELVRVGIFCRLRKRSAVKIQVLQVVSKTAGLDIHKQ